MELLLFILGIVVLYVLFTTYKNAKLLVAIQDHLVEMCPQIKECFQHGRNFEQENILTIVYAGSRQLLDKNREVRVNAVIKSKTVGPLGAAQQVFSRSLIIYFNAQRRLIFEHQKQDYVDFIDNYENYLRRHSVLGGTHELIKDLEELKLKITNR